MPLLCQGCLIPLVYLLNELLHDKYLSLPNDNHLYCFTSENTRGQLGRKGKAAFSIEYQFVYPFWGKSEEDTLSPSGQPTSFHAAWNFLTKSVQNLVLN